MSDEADAIGWDREPYSEPDDVPCLCKEGGCRGRDLKFNPHYPSEPGIFCRVKHPEWVKP
jgi:hypothetical protein